MEWPLFAILFPCDQISKLYFPPEAPSPRNVFDMEELALMFSFRYFNRRQSCSSYTTESDKSKASTAIHNEDTKTTRRKNLGWKHRERDAYEQVFLSKGGGTHT